MESFKDELLRSSSVVSANDIQKIEEINDLILTLVKKRKELEWTQEQLAKVSGLTQPTVTRIENSIISPRLDTLEKLAQALGYKLVLVELED
ncbi:helix-turn-helix domain-containing protein [Paenibacillus aurantiacus]|uniref:Helix-turn-helix domain-containing protein n=1 Tax=Paenibacillus aurantiacus TaxID=1936118 RepID=A0ABV5KXW5_9BACL